LVLCLVSERLSSISQYFTGLSSVLTALQATLKAWLKCQAGWLYLGPVFGSDDIMHQIPNEGRKFQAVDATWRATMVKLLKTSEVIVVAGDTELLHSLEDANGLLNQVRAATDLGSISWAILGISDGTGH
jgi:hypothetical protein